MQPVLDAFTLEYPTNWTVTPMIGEAVGTTLNGQLKVDVMYRKYMYNLSYEALSKTDFEILQNAINGFIDSSTLPTFTYAKIAQASTGVVVKPRLSGETRIAGAGTGYYVSVELELVEINSRI